MDANLAKMEANLDFYEKASLNIYWSDIIDRIPTDLRDDIEYKYIYPLTLNQTHKTYNKVLDELDNIYLEYSVVEYRKEIKDLIKSLPKPKRVVKRRKLIIRK